MPMNDRLQCLRLRRLQHNYDCGTFTAFVVDLLNFNNGSFISLVAQLIVTNR